MSAAEDPFIIDVRRDLERIDQAMSSVLADRATADEFVRDPNRVLSRLGMHPETTPEIHDRVNRIFYAVLTNRELVAFVLEHFSSFDARSETATHNESVLKGALAEGRVEHSVEFDVAVADHFFRQPDALKRVYQLTLHDLNRRGLLQELHPDAEIDEYVERLVESISLRQPISELPELERWDDNYGVGTGYGVGALEVGPAVTVALPVEAIVVATVVVPVWVLGVMSPDIIDRAVSGDPGAMRTVSTAGALFQLAGEVLIHAEQFER